MSQILRDHDEIMKRIESGENFREILSSDYAGDGVYIIRSMDPSEKTYTSDAFLDREKAVSELYGYKGMRDDYAFLIHGTIDSMESGKLRGQVTEEPIDEDGITLAYFYIMQSEFKKERNF